MGIETHREYWAICDKCGKLETGTGSYRSNFEASLRARGWSIGETVKCPSCKNKASK